MARIRFRHGYLPWHIIRGGRVRLGYLRGRRSVVIVGAEEEPLPFVLPWASSGRPDPRLTNPQIESLPHHSAGIGRRERISAAEQMQLPYASICCITGGSSQGTGFLIEGGRIVTAAHVIKGAVSRTVSFPGSPSFDVSGSKMKPHEDYREEGDLHDVGIIHVDPVSIAGVVPLPTRTPNAALLAELSCEIAGYPIDLAEMTRYPKHGGGLPDTSDEITLSDGFVRHRLDTTRGQSGAPILARKLDGTGGCFVIGVHCFGEGNLQPGWLNRGVPMPAFP